VTQVVVILAWLGAAGSMLGMMVSAGQPGRRFWVLLGLALVLAAIAGNRELTQDTAHRLTQR
jgi:hypothetical protein